MTTLDVILNTPLLTIATSCALFVILVVGMTLAWMAVKGRKG